MAAISKAFKSRLRQAPTPVYALLSIIGGSLQRLTVFGQLTMSKENRGELLQ